MICDLHSHSSVSDGMLSPEALVAAAAEQRVDVLALTDHDDVSGVHAAAARGRTLGVRLLPGVEISVSEDEGRVQMHVLGLGVRPEHPDLLETLRGLREARQGRAARMLERLAGLGIALDAEPLLSREGVVGRPHVARALVAAGACSSTDDAFVRYLRRGRPAYEPSAGLSAQRAIDVIHGAGGIACLAHPPLSAGVDGPGGLAGAVERLASLGLDGLEVWHPGHRPAQIKRLGKLARERSLVPTGGSDFHGDGRRELRLGRGRGNLRFGAQSYQAVCDAIRARGGVTV